MRNKKHTRGIFRKSRQSRKTKRRRAKKYHRGGGSDIYPLSNCGGAVGRCDPYVGTANLNGGWRLKDVSGRKSAERTKYNKRKRMRGNRGRYKKTHSRKTRYMKGGSTRDPIIGSELQQGLFSIWNTGEKAYNTWNGVKSPFSLDASPLNQPIDSQQM